MDRQQRWLDCFTIVRWEGGVLTKSKVTVGFYPVKRPGHDEGQSINLCGSFQTETSPCILIDIARNIKLPRKLISTKIISSAKVGSQLDFKFTISRTIECCPEQQ